MATRRPFLPRGEKYASSRDETEGTSAKGGRHYQRREISRRPGGDMERSRSRVLNETPSGPKHWISKLPADIKPPSGPKHWVAKSSMKPQKPTKNRGLNSPAKHPKGPKNRVSKLPAKLPQESQSKAKQRPQSQVKTTPVLDERDIFCIERIFKALQLLSYQVLNMDQGILPNRNELDVYQDYRVAACERCYSISSEDLHAKLLDAQLWPLGPRSHALYEGTLFGLIRKIQDMERDLLSRARSSMRPGMPRRDCNQLTHLSERLDDLIRTCEPRAGELSNGIDEGEEEG